MTAPNEMARPNTAQPLGSILLVDDETNILTSLKRLFRPTGYRIMTAESGQEGLAILESEPIDVIISDMRMPHMSGAQFLEKVRADRPDIVRILLTGHSDMASTIEAINKGEIFRYLCKPWDDREVLMIVRQALNTKRLLEEKRLLEAQVQLQNEELKQLNESLEQKVDERTRELQQTMQFLEKAHGDLKNSFITSIKVFSNLIEMREGSMAGHSRRVAELARSVAMQLGLRGSEAQDVFVAALLHDIGKIGFPDPILKKPYAILNLEERTLVNAHPVKGQAALMALGELSAAALIIRHHHERYDGQGYPDGLARLDIPLGARILAVVNDFDALTGGTLYQRKYTRDEALKDIWDNAGKSYDPDVVRAFIASLRKVAEKPPVPANAVSSDALVPGMMLAQDLIAPNGELLLAKDFVIDQRIIDQIRGFETAVGRALSTYIKVKG